MQSSLLIRTHCIQKVIHPLTDRLQSNCYKFLGLENHFGSYWWRNVARYVLDRKEELTWLSVKISHLYRYCKTIFCRDNVVLYICSTCTWNDKNTSTSVVEFRCNDCFLGRWTVFGNNWNNKAVFLILTWSVTYAFYLLIQTEII